MQAKTLVTGAKPFVKWAGGKTGLLPQIAPLLPQVFKTYHEPFIGSGALFFYLQPQKAVISDTLKDLTIAYSTVRDSPSKLVSRLNGYAAQNSAEFYYAVRHERNILAALGEERDPVEVAVELIYLNKAGFNGVYRLNSKGEFNTPYGKGTASKPSPRDLASIFEASKVLQGATIRSGDFTEVVSDAISGDFVYFDPPYYPVKPDSFIGYGAMKFSELDHIRLLDCMKDLGDRGVQVMLSNSDTPFTRDLFKVFTIHTVFAVRSVNSKGCDRGKVSEILVTNY